jgi:hypothetical protein
VDPCKQEEIIKEIKAEASAAKDKLHEMEVRQVKIDGNIEHIKGRIDNGMSHTIHSLDQTLTKLEPVLNHHSEVIRRIEGMGWTLATTLLLALLGYLAYGISNGFKLHL